MTQIHISPISAAAHYATSAAFWEGQAKALRHELDQASARIIELEALLPVPSEATAPEPPAE